MNYRKLRIAWSVGVGHGAVLLIVLWVHTLHNQVEGQSGYPKLIMLTFVRLGIGWGLKPLRT